MNNCPNCGTARKGTDKFCLNCGSKLEELKAPIEASPPIREKKKVQPSPKKSKLKTAGLIAAAALLLTGIGTHFYLQSKYDAMNSIVEMNQAFGKSDPETFFSYFTIPKDVTADEAAFYSFVEEEGWESLRDQLRSETRLLQNEELSNIILDSNGNKFISVINEPVLFGLYDHITFLVHPINVQAEMPLDGTNLAISKKTVTGNKGETVSIGKFIPGSYKWNASVESKYAPIESSGTEKVYGNGSNNYVFSPQLAGGTVKITSDVENAILWIDGKSTGKTVKEMSTINPVPFNGSLKLSAEAKDDNGKNVKGEEVEVNSETAHISFAYVQEKEATQRAKIRETEKLEELADLHEYDASGFVTSFRNDFESALNYGNFSYISSYFPPGSEVQADYIADIKRHNNMDNYYDYDFESTTVTGVKALDEHTLEITTDEVFLFTSEEDTIRFYRTKVYTVDILDYGYYITNIKQLSSKQNAA